MLSHLLQDVAFVGSGYNGEFLDDLYAYRLVLGVDELSKYDELSVYPNPANNAFNIAVDPQDIEAQIITIDGKDVTARLDIDKSVSGFHIERGALPAGNYIINLSHKELGNVYQGKIVFL